MVTHCPKNVFKWLHQLLVKNVCLSLQDLVNPSVVVLDPSSFNDRVKGKTSPHSK